MSSCLSSRAACGFDLAHLVKWQSSISNSNRTISNSNSSSPSSTLSESTNSPITISNQKPRTPRKRPNQTYNEAAALLSMASPTIFKINHLPNNRPSNNFPKFTNFFKPCSLTDLKITNLCQETGEIDDFDTGSILNDEIEQGIDSIMGDSKPISINNESNNDTYYGFGVRNALRNAGDRNWRKFMMVDVVNTSPPAVIRKCERSPVGKKKKKRVEELMKSESEVRRGLMLKLDYDGVLHDWADKGSPVPEKIYGHIHAKAANIDLFSEEGGWNESSATRPMDKNHLKICPVKNACSDKRPRCKGRFVKKPNSSGCDEVTY